MKKTSEDQLRIMRTTIELLKTDYTNFGLHLMKQLSVLTKRIDQIIKEETK